MLWRDRRGASSTAVAINSHTQHPHPSPSSHPLLSPCPLPPRPPPSNPTAPTAPTPPTVVPHRVAYPSIATQPTQPTQPASLPPNHDSIPPRSPAHLPPPSPSSYPPPAYPDPPPTAAAYHSHKAQASYHNDSNSYYGAYINPLAATQPPPPYSPYSPYGSYSAPAAGPPPPSSFAPQPFAHPNSHASSHFTQPSPPQSMPTFGALSRTPSWTGSNGTLSQAASEAGVCLFVSVGFGRGGART